MKVNSKFKLSFILALVFLSISHFAQAQENYYFRHLSTGDGLSQSSVISIAQDKKGLLWFATRDGLNSYDGNKFTVYRNKANDSTTISNNDVLELLVDSSGNLWVGTYNGLNHYNYSKNSFQRYYNDNVNPNSLSNNTIWALAEAANGDIWIGTSDGLSIYRNGSFQRIFHRPNDPTSLSGNQILDIMQDSSGKIWVATAKGLNRLLSDENGKYEFERIQIESKVGGDIGNNYCQSLAEDHEGNIWIGTKRGLYKYESDRDNWEVFRNDPNDPTSLSHNDVRSISFDHDNVLWAGTYEGLNKMKDDCTFSRFLNNLDIPGSLSKNTIKSTIVDHNGSLWIGMYYGGINILDDVNNNFINYKQLPAGKGLSYDVVSSIVEDGTGKIYIGTEGGGINILDEKENQISQMSAFLGSRNNIKALEVIGNRYLWVGTLNSGLFIYDIERSMEVAHYNTKSGLSHNGIYSILQENDSLSWIGTFGGGLNLLNTQSGTVHILRHNPKNSSSISNDQIRIIEKDSKGNLWVGTQYGLNKIAAAKIRSTDFSFEHYFYNQSSETGEDILAIFEDRNGTLWVGTNDSGLSYYEQEADRFIADQSFFPSDGTSNIVHGILEDDQGFLWLSTNQGIKKYKADQDEYQTYDESDGLVSNEFNNNASFKSASGRMYFGGPQGISSFFPEKISINNYAPKTILTDFKLFNESVEVGGSDEILEKSITETEKISLDYDQTIFTLEFAIPNFINPDKNTYKYRLKGLEQKWNTSNKNTATYTIQKSGTYLFQVQGINNDGVISQEMSTLEIVVEPAPWRTWWAFLLYLFVIILSLYALTNIIISRSKFKHDLELEYIEKERQKSINQMKLRFFTNISHEFRTPLTLILGPLQQVLNDYKGSNKTYKQLKVVEKNAVRLLKLINQLLDFRKLENKHEKIAAAEGNVVRFVEEIFLSFKQYAKIHDINYSLVKDSETVNLWYDRDKLERVFYNLISNAFKYTEKGGDIKIRIGQEKETFYFHIADTGVGMDPEHIENIFNRFYEIEVSGSSPKHPHQKGTGIGLSIAQSVVKMHNGLIDVESEKGKGTIFKVKIPLGNAHFEEGELIRDFKDSEDLSKYVEMNTEVLDAGMEESEQKEIEVKDEDENKPSILVVEDNASVRMFITQIFKNEYRVEEAENGMQGLKMATRNVPDLIISDVMMPEMDGIEFCSQIKSNLKTSHIPFILLTARTSLVFKFEGLESGADEYISKPFNVRELQLKARNIIATFQNIREKFANNAIVKPSEITVSSMDEELLKKAIAIVDENISNEFLDVPLFATELGVSRTVLFTKIKAWTNMTPNEFIQSMRMKRAAQLLEQNKISISKVCYKVGYKDPKYFRKSFRKFHDMSPSEYAKKFFYPAEEDK